MADAPRTILVAGAGRTAREVTRLTRRDGDAAVIEVQSARAALDALEGAHLDVAVVVLDVAVFGTDEARLIRWIWRRGRKVAVVVMSSRSGLRSA